MKVETRILVTVCSSRACIGVVLRGSGVDGSVGGKDCIELCEDLIRRGYRGETRYALGDCKCGLPSPPHIPAVGKAWSKILADVISFLESREGDKEVG